MTGLENNVEMMSDSTKEKQVVHFESVSSRCLRLKERPELAAPIALSPTTLLGQCVLDSHGQVG